MAPRDSEKTRRALLDATRELLESPGATEAGLERIAARAGYSRQAVYRHFGSRAGLLKAVLADIDERGGAEASVEEILAARDADSVLDALVAWWAGYVAGFAGVARSVYAGRGADPALAAAWKDRMEALARVCELVVDRCAAEGRLRAALEPSVATEILWGLLSIPLWNQLIVDRDWSEAEYRQRIGTIAQAALLAVDQVPTGR
jgi:AcrR family transcriptional regulator